VNVNERRSDNYTSSTRFQMKPLAAVGARGAGEKNNRCDKDKDRPLSRRLTGTITFVAAGKCFGFIKYDTASPSSGDLPNDYHFHFDQLKFGRLLPKAGDTVTFSVKAFRDEKQRQSAAGSDKKPVAVNVQPLKLVKRTDSEFCSYIDELYTLCVEDDHRSSSVQSYDKVEQRTAAMDIASAGDVWVALLKTVCTTRSVVSCLDKFFDVIEAIAHELDTSKQQLSVFLASIGRVPTFFGPQGPVPHWLASSVSSRRNDCMDIVNRFANTLIVYCTAPGVWAPTVKTLMTVCPACV
jgi:cold shock CspA family protein